MNYKNQNNKNKENMKSYNYILTLILLIIGSGESLANKELQEYRKTISEDFQVNEGTDLYIENKYGNIDIETADQNTIHIDVEIIVEARNQERADDIMSKIDISFDNSGNRVQAKTNYDFGNSWKWGKKSESYKVHYKITMPKNIDLNLTNKYGDISVTDVNGDVYLYLKYGSGHMQDVGGDMEANLGYVNSFDMGNIGGDLELDMAYSHFSVEDINDVDITSKYSHIDMAHAKEIDLTSKYDKYTIESALSIQNDGKYDEFKIGYVESFEIDTKYTHIRIEELVHSGTFYTGYGGIKIRKLGAEFKSIIIDSNYTGVNIGLSGPTRLNLDTEYVYPDLPDDLTFSYKERDGKEFKLQGFYKSKNSGIIEAEMKYGNLDIREKY